MQTKKRFETIEYSEASYQEELQRIYTRFSPLVKICKEEGTVMRIGTNHGSLSDRIMSRYGDTPLGMVESALEFIRICEDHNFYDIVISMKASNPQVMVQAYRLLSEKMLEQGRYYPLHLGVTEAGEGEDGRIKSALGIASLLMDGIGDTVRVSLTEDPEFEVPVAQFLVDHFINRVSQPSQEASQIATPEPESIQLPFDPYSFSRRQTLEVENMGGKQVPRVIADIRHNCAEATALSEIGYTYIPSLDKYNFSDIAADFAFFGDHIPTFELPGGLKRIYTYNVWRLMADQHLNFPFYPSWEEFQQAPEKHAKLNFVQLSETDPARIAKLDKGIENCVWVLHAEEKLPAYSWRKQIYTLMEHGLNQPVILRMHVPEGFFYYSNPNIPDYVKIDEDAKTQLALSADGSSLLVDGLIDGLWMERTDNCRLRTAFGMLQLARLRITKTEYISCPSCGRTLFDLQETTARIRKRTEHLKGVKIGIMGCIVNGPGEMADADYGYVGVGPGKISLYRGQEVVEKGVKTEDAVDKLIDLIREDGMWVEPELMTN